MPTSQLELKSLTYVNLRSTANKNNLYNSLNILMAIDWVECDHAKMNEGTKKQNMWSTRKKIFKPLNLNRYFRRG